MQPSSTHSARPADDAAAEISLRPSAGWHCSHLYYRFDRAALAGFSAAQLDAGRAELLAAIDAAGPEAPARLQVSVVSGHRADFGLMLLDPDPLRIDAVHQRLMAGPLGPALTPTYSFISLTEVSEYVPTMEQYAPRLVSEGEDPEGATNQANLKAY